MIFIGIDTGMTGAIAIIYGASSPEVYDFQDPRVLDALAAAVEMANIKAAIEKVHAMPKQGVSTTFKFGVAYGQVQGWLDMLKIPYEFVTPTKWWRGVADSAGKGKDKKQAALDLARRLFPSIASKYLRRKKDHNRAEALLIAEYLRRQYS